MYHNSHAWELVGNLDGPHAIRERGSELSILHSKSTHNIYSIIFLIRCLPRQICRQICGVYITDVVPQYCLLHSNWKWSRTQLQVRYDLDPTTGLMYPTIMAWPSQPNQSNTHWAKLQCLVCLANAGLCHPVGWFCFPPPPSTTCHRWVKG